MSLQDMEEHAGIPRHTTSDTYLFYYPDQPTGKKTENVCEDGSTYKLNEQTSDILLAFKKFLEQQAQHQHTLQDSDADKTETFAAQLRKALKNAGERTNTHAPTIFVSHKKGSW